MNDVIVVLPLGVEKQTMINYYNVRGSYKRRIDTLTKVADKDSTDIP